MTIKYTLGAYVITLMKSLIQGRTASCDSSDNKHRVFNRIV